MTELTPDHHEGPRTPGVPEDALLLRQQGLRVTRPRLAVMEEVRHHPHADVEAITSGARSRLGTVSTQAVYDVLRALADAGLVRRFQATGAAARYELTPVHDHHHLVCRGCGRIVDVDVSPTHAGLAPADDQGFRVEGTEVTFWGKCPDCLDPSTARPIEKERS